MWRNLLLVCCGSAMIGCVELPVVNPWAAPSFDQMLEKDLAIGTIGEVTEVANAAPIQLHAVGLVTGLDGTGHSPTGYFRSMLEQQLRKQKIDKTKELLDSPNNSLVLVTGFMPPGVRKGELFDIEITLPQGSRTTSLAGGILHDCPLRTFELASNINPEKGEKPLSGHVLAKARGHLIVGLGDADEGKELRRARVWSGAVSAAERPYYFVLKKEDKSDFFAFLKDEKKTSHSRVTNSIANRLNVQFQDDPKKLKVMNDHRDLLLADGVVQQLNRNFDSSYGKGDMAKAIGKEVVTLRVPYAYRYHHDRFLCVARLLPLMETPEQMGKYRKRLEAMLADPKYALRAGLRLEALGKDSIPVLKKQLVNPDPTVRFHAAESLTYLGSTAGIEELAKLAAAKKEMRAYALIAMAGLDEAICRTKLAELMNVDDPELRSGAFRALRLLDDGDPRTHDAQFAAPFSVHKVAPESPPLVLYGTSKRAEVVLFGRGIQVVAPVKVLAGGEFTITADREDSRLNVSRHTANGAQRQQCGFRVEDLLQTMSDLGASYTQITDLLKILNDGKSLSCPALPSSPPQAAGLESVASAAP